MSHKGLSPRRARGVLWLCAGAVLLYYLLTPGVFGTKAQGDGWLGFHYLPALVLHQTVDMRPVAGKDRDAFDRGRDGRLVNRNPIGPTLAMLPVYLLTLLAELIVRLLVPGAPWLLPSPLSINVLQLYWTGLITLAAGLGGMALTYRFLRRRLAEGPALVGALSTVLATPLFWYLTTQPHYQHGLAFAAVALLVERWDRTRDQTSRTSGRRFFFLGLLAGLAMLMRAQEGVFLLLPGLELLAAGGAALRGALMRRRGEAADPGARDAAGPFWPLRGGLWLGAGALLGFLPQLLCWTYYFGFLARPATIEILRPLQPALLMTLLSTRCGLLPWSPVVYVALAGLCLGLFWGPRGGPRLRRLCGPLCVVLLADLYLVASSWIWYGAFSFGSRRLSDCAPIFALGVGLCCQRVAGLQKGAARRLLTWGLGCLLCLFVAGNLVLVDLARRRVIPSSGSQARPAYRWAQLAHAPAWLVRLLRHGYPFVQPAGWLFALWHHAPVTAWEAVAGNYALEREAHVFSLFGDRWDFTSPEAEDYVVEGLSGGPQQQEDPRPAQPALRPVLPHVRMLLVPFGSEPIRAELCGQLPPGDITVRWDGHLLATSRVGDRLQLLVPVELVHPHRVAELTFDFPASAQGIPVLLSHLQLYSDTAWWKGSAPARPELELRDWAPGRPP